MTEPTPARQEIAPVAAVSNSQAMMDMAKEIALNPQADVEKLRQVLEIAKEARREEAEAAFNDAMSEAQSEMGRIATNKDNSQTKSKYADYAALDRVLRPIYIKHGFALSFDTEAGGDNFIWIIAHVTRGGFSRDYRAPMPTDGKGPQGAAVMTKTHATGAAMTYGMRYLLKMIFNVAIGEDDTDGNMPGETISLEQLADLQTKIAAVEGDTAVLCEHFGINSLAEMPVKDLPTALKIIDNKAKKMGK